VNRRERRLVLLFAAMVLFYAVPFEVAPAVWGYLRGHHDYVQGIRDKLRRYERLIESEQEWRQRSEEYAAAAAGIEAGLVSGETADLIAAGMVGVLREISAASGAAVKSIELPEFNTTGEWLMVTQTLHFAIQGAALRDYINAVSADEMRFRIIHLDLRSQRGLIDGSMKVVGFARRPGLIVGGGG
jgi:hypothetical protein